LLGSLNSLLYYQNFIAKIESQCKFSATWFPREKEKKEKKKKKKKNREKKT